MVSRVQRPTAPPEPTLTTAASSLSVRYVELAAQPDALSREFQRCATALFRYFAIRVGDSDAAGDLMQQLWLAAASSARRVPEPELEYWLRGIAAKLLASYWRSRKRRSALGAAPNAALAHELSQRLGREPLPDEWIERQDVRAQLLLALSELPADEQELIVEHYFHGREFADLARQLGVTPRAIEGRLYRARSALRERLRCLE